MTKRLNALFALTFVAGAALAQAPTAGPARGATGAFAAASGGMTAGMVAAAAAVAAIAVAASTSNGDGQAASTTTAR